MNCIPLIFRIAIFLTPVFAIAVPFRTENPISLKGEIREWVWRETMHYAEQSQGSWFTSTVPAHYLVVVDVPDADREQLKFFTGLVSSMPIRHQIMDVERKPNEVLLLIPSKRLKEMREGVTLEITNYSLQGDERDTIASFDKFTIDGKKPTTAGPLFPAESTTKRARQSKPSAVPSRAKKKD